VATIVSVDSAINADLDDCAQGDVEGLRRLVASQSGRLRASVERRVGNAGVAERVVHDVFVHVWEAARAGRPASDYPADWIFAVARAKADEAMRAGSPPGKPSGTLDPVRTVQRRLSETAGADVPSAAPVEGRGLPFLNGSRPKRATVEEPEAIPEMPALAEPPAGSIDDMRMRRPGLAAESTSGVSWIRRSVMTLALLLALIVAAAVGIGVAERAGWHSPLLDPLVLRLKAMMAQLPLLGSEPLETPLLAPDPPAPERSSQAP
jgi:hypothetical protein